MKFCIIVIARNESANIHKMAESAKDYLTAGGKIYLLDTGSTDDTVDVARKLGFNVTISKTNFHKTLTQKKLNSWKAKYKIGCTPLKPPITFFCFDDARNAASEIPEEDIMFFADGCDYFINLDYDHINKLIEEGHNTFTVIQKYGGEKGRINRFYNRKTGKWTGHVHEYVECGDSSFYYLPENVFCIEHRFVEKDRADKYMAGLIFTHDSFPNDEKGRWHYYTARELMFRKNYSDAKRLFQKRVDKLYYPEERASSLCYSAKCCKLEGGFTDEEIISYYEKAYNLGTSLCEPLFEICEYNFKKQNWSRVLKVATECLELIKSHDSIFFEEERFTKKENLYWYLYHGHWWAGTKDMAMYYWRSFAKSRNIIEEKHEYWKFLHKYKYFPAIPYTITDFKQSNDSDEIYKCITTIEDTNLQLSLDEQILMKLTRKYLPPCANVVDVSAGRGFYSITMSKAVYPAVVHAFEISKFKELNANAFINSRENIKTYEIALSNLKWSFDNVIGEDIICPVAFDALDNISISEVGYIKVGAQHSNCGVLSPIRGSINTIKYFNPTIAITDIAVSNTLDSEEERLDTVILPLNYTKMRLKNTIFYIPDNIKRKKVAIVCYTPSIKWDQTQNNNRYIEFGESEQAVINLATSLANKNIIVDVWGNPTHKFSYGTNPRYLNYKNFHCFIDSSEYYDVVIYWRYAQEIKTKHPNTKNILWLHDYVYPDIDEKLIDSVVFLSDNHRTSVLNKIGNREFVEKISHVIPNCIHVKNSGESSKTELRCVYLNNHAYGLELLLDSWEKIQTKLPSASLHILHSFQTWGIKSSDEEKALKDRISKMRIKNVTLQHTLSQTKLQEELEKSSFWLYPCIHEEPFCIQGVQATLSGVIPIVSDQVFLKKLTPERCVVWPLKNDNFADKCIEIMSLNEDNLNSIRQDVMSKGESLFCDLEKVYGMFTELF